jgi:uncharacterized protein (AIM24 family)
MAFLNRRPTPLPTQQADATAAGYSFHLAGELVPVLTVELAPGQTIFFEHHILLWKEPSVQISVRPLAGMLKRMIAGMQVLVTEARGPGQIAVSRDGVGQIFPLQLSPGQEVHVREHQFLAGTDTVDYTWKRVSGVANMLFGGSGFFIDRFHANGGDGIVWLHGHGNVFEKLLADGEQIDVEPGGWLYKDPSVRLETNLAGLSTGFLAGSSITLNRFTGPGRLGLQSASPAFMSGGADARDRSDVNTAANVASAAFGVLGGLAAGLLGGDRDNER